MVDSSAVQPPAADVTSLVPVAPLAHLLGDGLMVPLATGADGRAVDLDAAASTRALAEVARVVTEAMPWYASVHRGAGFPSRVSTEWYEEARAEVHRFVRAAPEHVVVFTRNTTEALNIAATTLPLVAGQAVLTTLVEHHANLLPWRRRARVVQLDPPPTREALLEQVEAALARERVGIVTMTGASNVTGEVFPIAEIAALAHRRGALFCLDAAQLAPHRPIDMAGWGVDALALSGHKMHAPFGLGALVVRRDLIESAEPLLAGGGAVDFVSDHEVWWTGAPERHEAGTPNVLGAVALAAACRTLNRIGMEQVAAHERALLAELEAGLDAIPGVTRYRLWGGEGIDRLGVATFNLDPLPHRLLAVALSAEHGIAVRDGCFCAHPYMTRLQNVGDDEAEAIRDRLRRGDHVRIPGAVRASFSVGSSSDDVAALLAAMGSIARDGPGLHYLEVDGDYVPDRDLRSVPGLDRLLGPVDGRS